MKSLLVGAILFGAGTAFAAGTVTLSLESNQSGANVVAGTTIDWEVTVSVSSGDNMGLALVGTDLNQDPGNPELFDLPPGDEGSIDATMTKFSRPEGISNPGEGDATTGFVGVQRGTPGEQNLKQIGGALNTFGEAGTTIGTEPNVTPGVGQGSTQSIVSGSFAAPSTPGTYSFSLENAFANTLDSIGSPPDFSPVSAATVAYGQQTLTITVVQPGDTNCDGEVDTFDIDAFIAALSGEAAYDAQQPGCDFMTADVNGDGEVDTFDIDAFINLISGS